MDKADAAVASWLTKPTRRFLSNTHDPKDPNARMYVVVGWHETPDHAWERYQEWLRGKIIAEPQATSTYTVAQLKEMGLVGVYTDDSAIIARLPSEDTK